MTQTHPTRLWHRRCLLWFLYIERVLNSEIQSVMEIDVEFCSRNSGALRTIQCCDSIGVRGSLSDRKSLLARGPFGTDAVYAYDH